MKTRLFIFIIVLISSVVFCQIGESEIQLVGARHPAVSPDGTQIAFSYMGDIWVVASTGGRAFQITDHLAYDHNPVWSPDGKWLAFSSNRMGNDDVYLVPAKGGIPRQLTYHTGNDTATDFSPDGKSVIFSSSRHSSSGIYKISVEGGNPLLLMDTNWSWAYHGKISPDGKNLLFAFGMEHGSWWRRGYSGSNTSEIWLIGLEDKESSPVRIYKDSSNCFWPQWGDAGGGEYRVYFVSDRQAKTKNIWSVFPEGSDLKPVTSFKDKDITFLSIASSAPIGVYERDFGLWKTDLSTGDSHRISIEAPAEMKNNQNAYLENEPVSEFMVSPDGKKIAAVVRGDIFVLSVKGEYARNITKSVWREREVDWDAESKNIIYVSDIDANPDIYLVSALGDNQPKKLTESIEDELKPAFSPDGSKIAYYRGKRELRMMDPSGENDRLILEADFGGRMGDIFAWSPDSRFIAAVLRQNSNLDIVAVEVNTGKTQALTNTAYDERMPVWSSKGDFILFSSNRFGHSFPEFTGKWDLYRLDLEPEKPEFDEDKFESLFKEEAESEKKEEKKSDGQDEKNEIKVKLDLEDMDLQTKTVTNTLGDDSLFVLPAGDDVVYFVSDIDGKSHLWKIGLEKKEREEFETFMPQITNIRELQCSRDGKSLYYLSRGRIGRIDLSTKKNESISFTTKIKIDRTADYEQMLAELYYTLQFYYYDADFHDVNWSDIYRDYLPVLQQVREDRDFYDYANMMIGHLNSSHTGIHGPLGQPIENPSAHLGAILDFSGKSIRLDRIIKNGPLYLHRDKIDPGDQLIRINEKEISPMDNVWKKLNGLLDSRIRLTFKDKETQEERTVDIKPVSAREEQRLMLEEWIQSRKEMVKNTTDDKVAYIYMRAMGQGDLARYLKELERDAVPRQGLILDLRYNFGGNVHDRVLQALMKPVYAKWRIRGLSETPQSSYGFSHKPVVLLINEVTLSDGEMTANGFKSLKRGTIVGETTYGWLIFTTSVRLMNGGYFRLPFWGCYTLDGKDLETSGGVQPDILVANDLNDELMGKDLQLDTAIETILALINNEKID
ncbi:MAG: PD40 domain-containing protein [Candidatus Aminicenantes bacterium]|nr:PD40 domain-containing protein [Candidatus Aminicenantes bacterium]